MPYVTCDWHVLVLRPIVVSILKLWQYCTVVKKLCPTTEYHPRQQEKAQKSIKSKDWVWHDARFMNSLIIGWRKMTLTIDHYYSSSAGILSSWCHLVVIMTLRAGRGRRIQFTTISTLEPSSWSHKSVWFNRVERGWIAFRFSKGDHCLSFGCSLLLVCSNTICTMHLQT